MITAQRRQGIGIAISIGVHLAGALIAVTLEPQSVQRAPELPKRAIEMFVVAPDLPPDDPNHPGLMVADEPAPDWTFPENQPTTFSIDDFKYDLARIADRAELLFPFLTPGLALEAFKLIPKGPSSEPLGNPLVAERLRERQEKLLPPLALSDKAMQRLIDETWARRHRWQAFQPIARLARAHDPATGALPEVILRYRDDNWLQPYEDRSAERDTRLWTELGLTSDHVDFIGFIREFASAHPSTRTTTELLLLLDSAAQSSRNILETLMETDAGVHLTRTRAASPSAHMLFSEVQKRYADHLVRRGLANEAAVSAFYDKVRIAILTGILRTTPDGYRAGDARFLLGTIYWKAGFLTEAVRWWREIAPDRTDSHFVTYSALLTAIRASEGGNPDRRPGRDVGAEIVRILARDHRMWVSFSYDRLDHFGYSFDTF